jgi:ABC-2 type transport system ATP-binding protein
LLNASSPFTVLSHITAPVLLSQGEHDSLFGLDQADATAKALRAQGTVVSVLWRYGGHDDLSDPLMDPNVEELSWFAQTLRGSGSATSGFQVAIPAADSLAEAPHVDAFRVPSGYPGTSGNPAPQSTIQISGPDQTIAAPADGTPASVSVQPGNTPTTETEALIPGQFARFVGTTLTSSMIIAGGASVHLAITASGSTDATLFLGLHVISPEGLDTLPANLVSPIRVTDLSSVTPTTVTVRLPWIVQRVEAGEHVELTVGTTDGAYRLPADTRKYTIGLPGAATSLVVPVLPPAVQLSTSTSNAPGPRIDTPILLWAIAGTVALAFAGWRWARRRRAWSRP